MKINIRPGDSRLTHCPFPKHKGKHWTEVVEEDRPYIEWLTSYDCSFEIDDKLYEALLDILEKNPG